MPTTKKGIYPYATKSHLLTLTSPCEPLWERCSIFGMTSRLAAA
jgi:hypothetical protein